MAIILMGELVAGIRGKVGGQVYSAGRSGPYVRAWARPARRRTALQMNSRCELGAMGLRWESLSGAERAAWDALTAAPPEVVENSLGEVVALSGWQWFCKLVRRRLGVSATPSLLAPSGTAPAAWNTWTLFQDGVVGWLLESTGTTDYFLGAYAVGWLAYSTLPGVASVWSGRVMLPIEANGDTDGWELDAAMAAAGVVPVVGGRMTCYVQKQDGEGLRSEVRSATGDVT